MTPLVIFGGSPFIEKVDVPRIIQHHHTLGLNKFSVKYPTDYAFMYDEYIEGSKAKELWLPFWFTQKGEKYNPKPVKKPFVPLRRCKAHNLPMLGIKYFCSSLASNWAIVKGFKEVYLVGVDHIETDTYFTHFQGYGPDTPAELTPLAHQSVKRYIELCAELSGAAFYQTNPDAAGWNLPYKDVKVLYGP